MRASIVIVALICLLCGGAAGYALGARTAMERERSAVQAAVEKVRGEFRERAASAGTDVRSRVEERLQDANRQPAAAATAATDAQPIAANHPSIGGGGGRQLDPRRQRCVGGFVREFGDNADEKSRRFGERDLLENGRRVECSGLLRK